MRTVIDVKHSAILHCRQLLILWKPGSVGVKEGLFERDVFVVKFEGICECTCSFVVCVQVDKRTTATNKFFSEQEMDGFLGGDVAVCSHLCKQALSSPFSRQMSRKTRAESGKCLMIRVRCHFRFAGVFTDIFDGSGAVKYRLYVHVRSPSKQDTP